MDNEAKQPEWPPARLLTLSIGSGLAMVGTYVLGYRLFEIGFDLTTDHSREPLLWGGLALVVGVILLGAPWWPRGPFAKYWLVDAGEEDTK